MTDRFLFVISPYLTGAAVVPACIARYMIAARRGSLAIAPRASDEHDLVRSTWRWAIAVVAVGHVAALAFPEHVLLWNRAPARLLWLEGAGVVAGGVALVALIALGVRRARLAHASASPVDVIAWTLLLIDLASGVIVAVAFRWASSWSAVTVAPYVLSLLRLEPSPALVGRLPLLARAHIFCAFAAAGVAPFTTAAQVMLGPLDRLIGWTHARVAGAAAAARHVLDGASLRLQSVTARIARTDGEEN